METAESTNTQGPVAGLQQQPVAILRVVARLLAAPAAPGLDGVGIAVTALLRQETLLQKIASPALDSSQLRALLALAKQPVKGGSITRAKVVSLEGRQKQTKNSPTGGTNNSSARARKTPVDIARERASTVAKAANSGPGAAPADQSAKLASGGFLERALRSVAASLASAQSEAQGPDNESRESARENDSPSAKAQSLAERRAQLRRDQLRRGENQTQQSKSAQAQGTGNSIGAVVQGIRSALEFLQGPQEARGSAGVDSVPAESRVRAGLTPTERAARTQDPSLGDGSNEVKPPNERVGDTSTPTERTKQDAPTLRPPVRAVGNEEIKGREDLSEALDREGVAPPWP